MVFKKFNCSPSVYREVRFYSRTLSRLRTYDKRLGNRQKVLVSIDPVVRRRQLEKHHHREMLMSYYVYKLNGFCTSGVSK